MRKLPPDLRVVENSDGSQEVRADSIGTLTHVLGEDGVVAFCRAFAAANRLQAMTSMAKLSGDIEYDGLKTRNLFTMFFVGLGFAHEAVSALSRLEAVLRNKGAKHLLELEDLQGIRNFRQRWGDNLSSTLRNKIAFHLDEDSYAAGVKLLDPTVSICLAHFDRDGKEAYFPLADDVLLSGAQHALGDRLPDDGIRDLAKALWNDQKMLGRLLFELQMRALLHLSAKPGSE
jgi:hypothetical protein